MAIKAAPIFQKVYLGDVSPDVTKLEGDDCPQEERAWVEVRQATEADNMEINAMSANQRWIYKDSGTETVQSVNPSEIRAKEVFTCLTDVGNIYADPEGKVPMFRFENHGTYNRVTGGFQSFLGAYGSLPSVVTGAMLRAVYQVNPDWDWLGKRYIKCVECGHTWDPSRSDWVDRGE
jgi:hypothetical protein